MYFYILNPLFPSIIINISKFYNIQVGPSYQFIYVFFDKQGNCIKSRWLHMLCAQH